jgi:hypothetical protein
MDSCLQLSEAGGDVGELRVRIQDGGGIGVHLQGDGKPQDLRPKDSEHFAHQPAQRGGQQVISTS